MQSDSSLVNVEADALGLRAERDAALRAARAAVSDLTRLTRVLTILSETGPLDVLLDRTFSTLSEVFVADIVALLTPRDADTCSVMAAVGLPEDVADAAFAAGPTSDLAAVLRHGEPIVRVSSGTSAAEDIDVRFRSLDVKSVVWVPMRDSEATVAGVLVLGRRTMQPFAHADVALLTSMAYRIGLAVEQAQRSRQLEQLVQEMKVQIAERQRAEDALRVRDRAIAATTTAIAISDLQTARHPIAYVNPAFERLTGYAAGEIVQRSMDVLNGPLTGDAERAEIRAALDEQREAAVTTICYRQDGTHFWSDVTVAPVRDNDGIVSQFVWLIVDVTERKRAEKQAETLSRSEKLRALGQMASGVAHDLNQSLMLIASYGDLAKRELDRDTLDRDELREMFTVVTQAAMDGGDTVKRLLRLSRAPLEGRTEIIDLTLLVREVIQLTAPRWRDAAQSEGRPIRVEVESTGQPTMSGTSANVKDAVMNLILNAVDALPRGGKIGVRLARHQDRVTVEVSDDGVGMPLEIQERIFEPFFTTKGDKGTGLGLATVFGIVESQGGSVQVQSVVGVGTAFRLEFLSAAMPPTVPETLPVAMLVNGRESSQARLRILAVDDEPALTKAIVRLLRPVGHQVTTASSGEEALEHLRRQGFDLVISDVGMGTGINGWQLAEQVRSGWPAVRFVLATGWGASIDAAEARGKGVEAVLAKPYGFDELVAVLAAAKSPAVVNTSGCAEPPIQEIVRERHCPIRQAPPARF